MGFDNRHYPNRKDWRRRYYGAEAFDASCRCHGGCDWCLGNRTHSTNKRRASADAQIDDFEEYDDERRK